MFKFGNRGKNRDLASPATAGVSVTHLSRFGTGENASDLADGGDAGEREEEAEVEAGGVKRSFCEQGYGFFDFDGVHAGYPDGIITLRQGVIGTGIPANGAAKVGQVSNLSGSPARARYS